MRLVNENCMQDSTVNLVEIEFLRVKSPKGNEANPCLISKGGTANLVYSHR